MAHGWQVPFREGRAVAVQRGTDIIKGIFTERGEFKPVEDCHITHNYPYFSDGYLLIQRSNYYRYINKDGGYTFSVFEKAYPFQHGYAACREYENVKKLKDSHYKYLSADESLVSLTYGNKVFDADDVDYLSSVNDEGTGIVVAKHKMYIFDANKKILKPVYPTEGETNVKKQAMTNGDESAFLQAENDTSYVLYAKSGKKDNIIVYLDRWHRATAMKLPAQLNEYKKAVHKPPFYPTGISLDQSSDKGVGLLYQRETLLPPQFQAVRLWQTDRAFARKGDKWGFLCVDPAHTFVLKVNKGNDVGFRHQVFETNIRLDFPSYLPSSKTRLNISDTSGCHLELTSFEGKDTENGNYIQYDCKLDIPESLPDTTTVISYPVRIEYDGLVSPIIDMPVTAWHVKYFNVDIDESESSISQGTYTFTINVNAERALGDNDYPFTVEINTYGLPYELEKLSETRWKCKIASLEEGVNNLSVDILEKGCPPSKFPYEITYQKPAPKNKNVGQVKIVKKPKPTPQPAPRPIGSEIRL